MTLCMKCTCILHNVQCIYTVHICTCTCNMYTVYMYVHCYTTQSCVCTDAHNLDLWCACMHNTCSVRCLHVHLHIHVHCTCIYMYSTCTLYLQLQPKRSVCLQWLRQLQQHYWRALPSPPHSVGVPSLAPATPPLSLSSLPVPARGGTALPLPLPLSLLPLSPSSRGV